MCSTAALGCDINPITVSGILFFTPFRACVRAVNATMASGNLMRNPSKFLFAAAGGLGLTWSIYAIFQRSPAESRDGTKQRLVHSIVSLDSGIATFADEVAALANQSGVTFIVQWEKLADCDVLPGRRLAVHAGRTSAERALSTLLILEGDADHSPIELDYFIDDKGRVVITSNLDAIESSATLHVYDVSDLLRAGPSRAEAADIVERIVTENANSTSWKGFGGTVGTYYLCGNQLCIVQSRHGQALAVEMLEVMREEVSRTGKLPRFTEAPTFGGY